MAGKKKGSKKGNKLNAYSRHVKAFAKAHPGMKGPSLMKKAAASWRHSGKKTNPKGKKARRGYSHNPAAKKGARSTSKSAKSSRTSNKSRSSNKSVVRYVTKTEKQTLPPGTVKALIGLRKAAHKNRKAGKKTPSGARLRLRALNSKAKVASGKIRGTHATYLKSHGLLNVNTGTDGIMASLSALPKLLPEVGVGFAGFLAVAWGANMLGKKIVEKWGANYASFAAPGVAVLLGATGFAVVRMWKSGARFSAPWLMGSGVALGAAVLTSVMVEPSAEAAAKLGLTAGSKISLARRLGLPFGGIVDSGYGFGSYPTRESISMGEYADRKQLSMGSYPSRASLNGVDRQIEDQLGDLTDLMDLEPGAGM